jgi:preprotein translocase subunit YajC
LTATAATVVVVVVVFWFFFFLMARMHQAWEKKRGYKYLVSCQTE